MRSAQIGRTKNQLQMFQPAPLLQSPEKHKLAFDCLLFFIQGLPENLQSVACFRQEHCYLKLLAL